MARLTQAAERAIEDEEGDVIVARSGEDREGRCVVVEWLGGILASTSGVFPQPDRQCELVFPLFQLMIADC